MYVAQENPVGRMILCKDVLPICLHRAHRTPIHMLVVHELLSRAFGKTTDHQRVCITGPLVQGDGLFTASFAHPRYHLRRRTAVPLGPSSAPGYDQSTSRCQTLPSIRTLGQYQPVIPGVSLIR
eukprot:6847-Pelagococcus_subviridis.AAC.1